MFPRRTQSAFSFYLALSVACLLVASFFFLSAPTPITHAQSQPEALGSLSGTVTNANGEPLSNISVQLQHHQSYQPPIETQSDNTGRYHFSSLQPGNYRLYFVDPNSIYANEFYSDASFAEDATTVSVSGNDVSGVDTQLSAGGSISLTIQDTQPITLTTYYVTLYKRGSAGGWNRYGVVTLSGENTVGFKSLPVDSYRLCVHAYYQYTQYNHSVECYDNVLPENVDQLATNASDIQIQAGQEKLLPITLNDRPQIEGVITGPNNQPLANIPVEISTLISDQGGGYPIASALTDDQGYFSFGYLSSGTYNLTFNEQRYASYENRNNYLPIYYPNEVAAIRSSSITIDHTTQLSLTRKLRPSAQIIGKVTLPDGIPLSQVNVYTYRQLDDGTWGRPEGCNALCTYSLYNTSTGVYTITQIFPGRYRLRADYYVPNTFITISSFYGGNSLEEADDFDITLGQVITGINFVIGDNQFDSSITGKVTANGLPQAGIDVGLFSSYYIDNTGMPIVSVKTNAEGNYRLDGLAAGTYTVGFRDPKGVYASTYYSETAETYYPYTTLVVSQSATLANINTELTPGVSIRGRVFTPQNVSPGGFTMQIMRYPPFDNIYIPPFFKVTTDANGYYEITGLRPGYYVLAAVTPINSGEFPYSRTFFYPRSESLYEADTILLGEGQNLEQVNFYLPGTASTYLPAVNSNASMAEATPIATQQAVPSIPISRPTPTATPESR